MIIDGEFLVGAFERDDPFTMENRYFYDLQTGDLHWFGDGSEDDEDTPRGTEEKCENDSNMVEVPGIAHGEWHDVFRAYLSAIGELQSYQNSIGWTLKLLDDDFVRYDWYDHKREYAEKKAAEWLEHIVENKK